MNCETNFIVGIRKRGINLPDMSILWESPYLPLTDRELQRIMDRLIEYGFVTTSTKLPAFEKDQGAERKMTATMQSASSAWFRRAMEKSPSIMPYFTDRFQMLELVKKELLGIDIQEMTKEELEEKLDYIRLFLFISAKYRVSKWD